METREIIITESGKLLIEPSDGFVIYGCLFKGDGQGGLLGGSREMERIEDVGIKPKAYTTVEFLDCLCVDLEAFREYIKLKESQIKKPKEDENVL